MTAPAVVGRPQCWDAAIAEHDLPAFDVARYGHVLILAAHPDDETLGASGCLQAMHDAGARLTLLVATDGEAAFPAQDAAGRASLAATRRRELRESLRAQGLPRVSVHWAGLPDAALAQHIGELVATLRPLAAAADVCLAPWQNDPHPDHRAAAAAARDAVPPGTPVWGYPVWLRPWSRPEDGGVAWHAAVTHRCDETQLRRKRAAIEAFDSQLRTGPQGEEAILPAAVVAHFLTGTELLFRSATPVTTPLERFHKLYATEPDPWHTVESEYERHKRAVTLRALGDRRYRSAVDVACGSGVLTAELATRCERLLAFDAVPTAVAAARAATTERPGVTVQQRRLPEDFPHGPFDLVVCSEILYYLGEPELTATLDAAVAALEPGGDLLAVNWLPATQDAARNGSDAHRRLRERAELRIVECHREERFLLQLCRRR